MKTIWKYELKNTDRQIIEMPANAIVLTVQVQYGGPCLWAIVNPNTKLKETRSFNIYGTGNPVPQSPGIYIGTYQLCEGQLVFHVFEES